MSDPIFQTSLQDMIKGIRSHKKDPSSYVSKEIVDIKSELRSTDPFLKAEAVRKLTYLQMLGYNVSWAAFAIVEVMSQPKFGHKRIGYLAANQSFDENTEVILLTTNLFKKEFSGGALHSTQYEMGLALNSLANIATKDLARDCISDLVLLMNHQKPYIRKKAVLCMYKLYVKYPQGLRLTFDKLKERLDDHESSVVSTAVNVICELANKNPRNYLAMAPKFFKLLTTSSNNWMLIKVVKLLGALVSEEPRLARKLLEPLATIIQNTGAKSLQYECIYTVTEALPYSKREDGTDAKNAPAVIKLCSDYLRGFIEDADQNLKYLGLVGLVKLMKSNARSVVEHREIVLQCLNDDDVTIRSKALELLAGIVSRKSLMDLVRHLMQHARQAEGAYRDEVISKILYMCKKEKYALVSDFSWYTSILLELAVLPGSKHGAEVADQLIEVALRVDTVRPYAVETMLGMLLNDQLVLGHARTTVCEVLKAAAWIVGEYCAIVTRISRDRSDSPEHGDDNSEDEDEAVYWIEGATGEDIRSAWRGQAVHLLVMEALLHPRTTNLPALVQKVYLQAAMKVFIRASCDCELKEVSDIVGVLRSRLPIFMQHLDLEVQERATTFRHLLAEFDILAMNWEDSTEEISKETPGAAAVGVTGSGNGSGLNDKEKQLMDLLEMPMYTQSSVRAVDEYGAKIAIDKSAILKAITAEEFYAVHSKAQRRVPVPTDVSLDHALNEQALDKLLSVEIPDDLNLNSLSLVHTAPQAPNAYSSGARQAASSSGGSFFDVGRAQYDDVGPSEHMSMSTGPAPSNPGWDGSSAGYSARNADDVFMLSSNAKSNADIIPLSKILGDNFEDIPASSGSKSRSGRSQKKGKSKRRSAEINTVEMVPAGAVESSEEEQPQARRGGGSKADGKKKKPLMDEDDENMDLGGVDITTPLRHDEVIHVQTHRVVPSHPSEHTGDPEAGIAATWHTTGEDDKPRKHKKHSKDKAGDGKEKDKGKKEKDRKSSKDKSATSSTTRKGKSGVDTALLLLDDSDHQPTARSTSGTGSQAVDNLLGIDLNAPVHPATSSSSSVAFSMPVSAVPSASDRIAAMFDSAEAQKRQQEQERTSASSASRSADVSRSSSRPQRESKDGREGREGKSKEKEKKPSGGGHFYLPAYSDDQLDVLYSLSCDDKGRGSSYPLHVRWKVVNHSTDGSVVSVGVMLQSSLLNVNPCSGAFVSLATNLASNTDTSTSTELGLYNPVEETMCIPCRLSLSVESLIGPEVRAVVSELRVTVCSTFTPHKLSEEGFAQALGKSNSSKWGSSTAKVAISGKPKSAFKALSGFLRAHIVESEYSKAFSMAAHTLTGGCIYVLAKVASGGKNALQLDIKCSCGTKQESDRVAQLVSEALNACTL